MSPHPSMSTCQHNLQFPKIEDHPCHKLQDPSSSTNIFRIQLFIGNIESTQPSRRNISISIFSHISCMAWLLPCRRKLYIIKRERERHTRILTDHRVQSTESTGVFSLLCNSTRRFPTWVYCIIVSGWTFTRSWVPINNCTSVWFRSRWS